MPPTTKVPCFIPLDAEKEKKIDTVLELLTAEFPTAPQLVKAKSETKDSNAPTVRNPLRLYAYAFLNSRGWEVKSAMEMAKVVIKYREAANADSRPILPVPYSMRGWNVSELMEDFEREPRDPGELDTLSALIDPVFSLGLHYWDKNGIPVFYLMVGRIDEKGLVKLLQEKVPEGKDPAEVLWPFVEHYMLLIECLARYQHHQKEKKKLSGVIYDEGITRGMTIVVDARKLSYKLLWKPLIDIVLATMKRVFSVFPDCVYQIYMVNAPTVATVAYSLVKPVLDKNIQLKVHILKSHETFAALEKLIDVKFIPSFLGGTCTCEGNCIRAFNPECDDNKTKGKSSKSRKVGEDVKVDAGRRIHRQLVVGADETVFCTFEGEEVEFYVFFLPKDSHAELTSLSPKSNASLMLHQGKYKSFSDSFFMSNEGTIIFFFDNTKAWLKPSKLHLMLRKSSDSTEENSRSSRGSGCSG